MKAGDLVKWSQQWLNGCNNALAPEEELNHYEGQVGIIIERAMLVSCWRVLWSDQDVCDVHVEYLEAICK
tara:strand:+ start:333 stop:542 length:210 start_codon:yes stop_codon:yes gene_type:complete